LPAIEGQKNVEKNGEIFLFIEELKQPIDCLEHKDREIIETTVRFSI